MDRYRLPWGARWFAASKEIVDQIDHIPEVDFSLAVRLSRFQRLRRWCTFEHTVDDIDHFSDIDDTVTVGIATLSLAPYPKPVQFLMTRYTILPASAQLPRNLPA
jgi:hypothetical protein